MAGFEGKVTDMAATGAHALNTQQGSAAAAALPSSSAPPVPPSDGRSSIWCTCWECMLTRDGTSSSLVSFEVVAGQVFSRIYGSFTRSLFVSSIPSLELIIINVSMIQYFYRSCIDQQWCQLSLCMCHGPYIIIHHQPLSLKLEIINFHGFSWVATTYHALLRIQMMANNNLGLGVYMQRSDQKKVQGTRV